MSKDWSAGRTCLGWSRYARRWKSCSRVVKNDPDVDPQAAADHLKKLLSRVEDRRCSAQENRKPWQRFKSTSDLVYELVRSAGKLSGPKH